MGTSRFHRTAAYTRCLRCAGAPRRPTSGSELLLHIPSWHAALSNPGKSDIDIVQNFDANIGLRRMTTGSALPTLPQSVPRGRSISWLHWFASATACQVACPPVRIRLGTSPATEDFYFQAFNVSVSLHVAGYNYNSDWTPLLAGLSPAGMAASFAARSFATDVADLACRLMSASLRKRPNLMRQGNDALCHGTKSLRDSEASGLSESTFASANDLNDEPR